LNPRVIDDVDDVNANQICRSNGKCRLSNTIIADGQERTLWFEVDSKYREMIAAELMDAAVVSCLLPAMGLGRDLVVQGPMSSKLYYNITHYLIPILKEFCPSLHTISIRPDSMHKGNANRSGGVMAGFSGGIDSFSNYYEHSGDRAPEEYHITHFVYNNVGSHGQNLSGKDHAVFLQRYEALRPVADRLGKPFIKVDSNLDEVIGMDFQLTHTVRNAVVALLMQKGIGKFLYASSYSFKKTRVQPWHDMAVLDPIVLPLVSTESLECIASGGQHTRVEKTICVSKMEASREYLDVCVHPQDADKVINCSRCWKCLRTALTISVLGRLDDYRGVLDIAVYRRFEKLFLIEASRSDDYFLVEIAELMRRTGFHIPRGVRLLSRVLPKRISSRISQRIIPALARRDRRLVGLINALLDA
jgi:hypothetical protein